jgi:hypothetical protein
MTAPSQPVAGVGVTDRQHEEAETGYDQYEIEHGCPPSFGAVTDLGAIASNIDWELQPAE